MITADGYSIEYIPKRNQIIINLPQTLTTITSTVAMVANRRTHLREEEQAAILAVVRAFMDGKDGENGKTD